MKKYAFCLILTMVCGYLCTQGLPVINPGILNPQYPTTSDQVMFITSVETPGQGHRIYSTATVDHSNFKILLNGCYFSAAVPGVETHTDTFYLGKLQFGNYHIVFSARLSDEEDYCHETDSNYSADYISVDAVENLKEQDMANAKIFPNPVTDRLNVGVAFSTAPYRLFSVYGIFLGEGVMDSRGVEVQHLSQGVYFLELTKGQKIFRLKFVKA